MDSSIIPLILAYAVAFLIMVAITRAIFSIGTIVRHLKAQTKFLSLMAEKQGVDAEVILKIKNEANKIEETKYSTI